MRVLVNIGNGSSVIHPRANLKEHVKINVIIVIVVAYGVQMSSKTYNAVQGEYIWMSKSSPNCNFALKSL